MHPHKTNADGVRKFLTRPYKDIDALLEALKLAAKARPDGTFISDQISTLAVGVAAKRVMEAFGKAYKPGEEINLIADECSKAYEHVDEHTRTGIVNCFIPLLAAATKAFLDVDLLTKAMEAIAKTLCDAREEHEQNGEPYTEDFLKVAKAVTKVMRPLVNNITHEHFIPDEDQTDDCDCPSCQMRRAMKANAPKKQEDIKMEVEHMQLTLDPKKPETWEAEIAKLKVPDEVKQMILMQVKKEHGDKKPDSPKMPPPTGFNVDIRRN